MIRTALFAALCAAPVAALEQCAPHDVMIERLADQYGEARQSVAVSASGMMIEVWSSEAGTWTATATDAAGQTCIVSWGDNYQTIPKGEVM